MATTVANMSIQLSRRLADEVSAGTTDGERWSAAQRLSALDSGVNQVVMMILGHANLRKSAYQLLGSLFNRESHSIIASGLALTSLSNIVAAGGVVNVECMIDGARVYSVEREPDDLQYAHNPHFQGNDKRPVYYILGNLLMLEVTLGSYPVSAFVHYIQRPKELSYTINDVIYTTSLETNEIMDEIILLAAVGSAQMMSDDQDKVALASQTSASVLQALIAHEFGKSNKRQKGDA